MQLFIAIAGSFIVFALVALALGIGILVRGKPMHAGCRALPDAGGCAANGQCAGECERRAK